MSPSRIAQAVYLAAHVLLILLLIAWSGSLLGLAAAALLLAPLPGMVRGHAYTCAWASMLVAIYCALLLSDGYARPAQQAWAFGLATLAAADFVGLVLFVRFRKREQTARMAA